MEWPKVDVRESFEDMERRLGISKEVDDVRFSQLGAYPSASYYSKREPKLDEAELGRTRAKFDRAAKRY